MVAVLIEEPRSVTATLSFSEPPPNGVEAYHYMNADSVTGIKERSSKAVKHEVTISNARFAEETPTLDVHGFQLFNRPAKHAEFTDNQEIEKEYYPESAKFLQDITGASRVVVFDHTVRRRRPGEIDDSPQKRQPLSNVHVDQSPEASIARVHRHLPASDVPSLLKKQFQIINIWRPINHPALDWPLALCDYRTVDQKDVFPVALIYPKELREPGETMEMRWNEEQKWWYWRGVKPEEAIVFKCFDSFQGENVARFTPHAAFADPSMPAGAPFRESIELRALVFYDQ